MTSLETAKQPATVYFMRDGKLHAAPRVRYEENRAFYDFYCLTRKAWISESQDEASFLAAVEAARKHVAALPKPAQTPERDAAARRFGQWISGAPRIVTKHAQAAVVASGVVAIALAAAFPPWYQQRMINPKVSAPLGFRPLWAPPEADTAHDEVRNYSVRLDTDRLKVECFAIIAGTIALAFVTRRRD